MKFSVTLFSFTSSGLLVTTLAFFELTLTKLNNWPCIYKFVKYFQIINYYIIIQVSILTSLLVELFKVRLTASEVWLCWFGLFDMTLAISGDSFVTLDSIGELQVS